MSANVIAAGVPAIDPDLNEAREFPHENGDKKSDNPVRRQPETGCRETIQRHMSQRRRGHCDRYTSSIHGRS